MSWYSTVACGLRQPARGPACASGLCGLCGLCGRESVESAESVERDEAPHKEPEASNLLLSIRKRINTQRFKTAKKRELVIKNSSAEPMRAIS